MLAKGQAALVDHAVSVARNRAGAQVRGKASSEWSSSLCRPCNLEDIDWVEDRFVESRVFFPYLTQATISSGKTRSVTGTTIIR